MKTFFTVLIFICSFVTYGQEVSESKKVTTESGWEIKKGDTLTLGQPSTERDFSYIKTQDRKGDKLDSSNSGIKVKINKLQRFQYPDGEDIRFAVTYIDDRKYFINIDNAIVSEEIIIPEAYKAYVKAGRSFPYVSGDTLYASNGEKFWRKQRLKIGTGSAPDADFKFIRRNQASLFSYYSTTGYQSLANSANALPRSASGHNLEVVRIEKRGNSTMGYVYYLIINYGMIRYEVDINNALSSGEVISLIKPGIKPQQSNSSVADEIIKLKKLLDEGVISTEEFEKQKSKLLNQ